MLRCGPHSSTFENRRATRKFVQTTRRLGARCPSGGEEGRTRSANLLGAADAGEGPPPPPRRNRGAGTTNPSRLGLRAWPALRVDGVQKRVGYWGFTGISSAQRSDESGPPVITLTALRTARVSL
jgi:hypothetical protein